MEESFLKSLPDISFRTPGDRLGGINCQRQDDSKQGGGTCASSETQAFCEIQQQRQRQWWKFKGTTTLRKGNYEICIFWSITSFSLLQLAATGSLLVLLFDELTRNSRVLGEGGCEEQFTQFAVSCLYYLAILSDQKFSCQKNRPRKKG